LAAELYGKEAGCSKGRGGSVHLTARDKGFIISSAILAQTIAVATGSALAFKMDNNQRVAVSFFGDAACEEGAFFESLNYAAIHQLPVLYICENNLYSTESTAKTRQVAGTSMIDRAAAFNIPSEVIDGNNVFTVYEAVDNILPTLRAGKGPFFLECMTYRWREHVGPYFDYEITGRTYRTETEQRHWMENKCPIQCAESILIDRGVVSRDEIESWKKTIQAQIDVDIMKAKESSWPQVSDLFENI
jgi:pyruvate dehydrogenase E1 component alpha subunit